VSTARRAVEAMTEGDHVPPPGVVVIEAEAVTAPGLPEATVVPASEVVGEPARPGPSGRAEPPTEASDQGVPIETPTATTGTLTASGKRRPSRAAIRAARPAGDRPRLRAVPTNEPEPQPERPAEKPPGGVPEAGELSTDVRPGPAELVELAVNVLRAAAASSGIPADEVERQVAETLAYIRRRLSGDYEVDEFGFDRDWTTHVHLPLLRPLYKSWFRVEVKGIENIPAEGGALVVSNHSGTVALDSLMAQVAVHDEHPRHRNLRMLGADLVFRTPFVGTMARRSGSTLADSCDAERLLRGGHLVGVWPEGFKGVGKPFSERYKLQRFGRGGFVSAALRAGVPIIPCSIVGAEEIYPIIGNMPTVARLLGVPYAPITPTFPLLGPLGMIPLPSKWLIEFGAPIDTAGFGEDAADDPMLVFDLTDQVRETIQQTLYSLLMQRKSVFI
jgi:1-acyl-sn-glycerol-3-phosphate acyltransferase